MKEKVYSGGFQFDELSPSWYPQAILANAAGLDESRAVVLRVLPDGTCTVTEAFDAIAKIDLNLRRYPFDRQRLEAVFAVLGFDSDEVTLTSAPLPASVVGMTIRVPQWEFEGISASIRSVEGASASGATTRQVFVVAMDVKRKSMFMLRLVVLPLMLIVALSWSVFWMDRSSLGDRVSVSFVGILTAVAYQIVLSDTLPKISYLTTMDAFLNLSMLLMCATVVINLVVGAFDKRGDVQLGHLIDRRCRRIFPLTYAGSIAAIVAFAFIFW